MVCTMNVLALKRKACETRIALLQLIYHGKTGHTGGALSCTDILTALFYRVMRHRPGEPKWEERDRFLLSKGHSVEGYYCILADLGYFDRKLLEGFGSFGSKLIGHPNSKVTGVEINTGALGHGLPIGVGMAIAAGRDALPTRVFVLMGDGEQAEGSVWEAAMAAGHYKLDNLYAIIDRNGLQISGTTEEVMSLEGLAEKWAAFGWSVHSCDGNDMQALCDTFDTMQSEKGRPKLLVARTVKGKGVSFMENVAKWHHGVPDEEQFRVAMNELQGELKNALEMEAL